MWTEGLGGASVLVNNAGGAKKGLEPIAEMDEERWRWMYEVNVLAMMTKSLLPQIRRAVGGHVVSSITPLTADDVAECVR